MAIVPLRGHHENWRSLMGEIMEDDGVCKLVIVTFKTDGNAAIAHFEMTRAEMAYAALLIQEQAMAP
jgi:hypothetical protein